MDRFDCPTRGEERDRGVDSEGFFDAGAEEREVGKVPERGFRSSIENGQDFFPCNRLKVFVLREMIDDRRERPGCSVLVRMIIKLDSI